ncbi:MAG: hypothetical protein EXR65_05350 [Dehalococcoidia bacterium]|nr:hypothetical protein [Dehalococcoidia bacterium]
MACPVHIWVPLLAVAAPFIRGARDRFVATRDRLLHRDATAPQPPRPMQRWAPIAPAAARPAEERTAPR